MVFGSLSNFFLVFRTNKHDNINAKREPYMDIMGYTINTASKMTWFAGPNQIVIGDAVYKRLDDSTKQNFG